MLCQSNCFLLQADGIAEFLTSLGHRCTERGVREMITKGRISVFKSPLNGANMVCREVIRYPIIAAQARSVQESSGSTETILPPPPPCMCRPADVLAGGGPQAKDE